MLSDDLVLHSLGLSVVFNLILHELTPLELTVWVEVIVGLLNLRKVGVGVRKHLKVSAHRLRVLVEVLVGNHWRCHLQGRLRHFGSLQSLLVIFVSFELPLSLGLLRLDLLDKCLLWLDL